MVLKQTLVGASGEREIFYWKVASSWWTIKTLEANCDEFKICWHSWYIRDKGLLQTIFPSIKDLMTVARGGRMDSSTFEDIKILDYNLDLWDAHLSELY